MRSPLHEAQAAGNASFTSIWGWEIADHFGSPQTEYDAVCRDAGALDLSYLGKLRVTGRDRIRYLHNMLSNDIKNLPTGKGCYAALLTHQGRIESDLHVYHEPDTFMLECPAAGTAHVLTTLNRFIVADDVVVEDITAATCILSLQGPDSRRVMERTLSCSLEGMEPLEHRAIPREPGDWMVVRRDRVGMDGFDLWLPSAAASGLWTQWVEVEGIARVGLRALDWLRTEAGIPWYGVDMDERNLPQEVGLSSAISLTKGCYRGQEIVARVHYRGHLDRRLGAVAVESDELPPRGAGILSGGSRIGEVSSAVSSPRLGRPLALGILKTEFLQDDTPVEVAYGAATRPGKVVSLPIR